MFFKLYIIDIYSGPRIKNTSMIPSQPGLLCRRRWQVLTLHRLQNTAMSTRQMLVHCSQRALHPFKFDCKGRGRGRVWRQPSQLRALALGPDKRPAPALPLTGFVTAGRWFNFSASQHSHELVLTRPTSQSDGKV